MACSQIKFKKIANGLLQLLTFCEFYVIIYPLNCENQIYIDSFAGMMSSLRKTAGKTNIPSSPRDKSILNFSTPDRFPKKCLGGSKS